MAFYETALGAERTMLMRFGESPQPTPEGMIPADWGDKVMHGALRVGELELMFSDGCMSGDAAPAGFAISLAVKADEVETYYKALGEGGQVTMPLGPTFFAKMFGGVTDRFGVAWMIVAPLDA